MLTLYYKNIRSKELTTSDKFKNGSWIYAENPNEQEIENLVNEYNLEEGLLKDALDPYEVPRIEIENNVTYLFTRFVYEKGSNIFTAPILIAIGSNFVLTICDSNCSVLKNFIKERVDFNTTQKTKFLLQVLMSINKDYKVYIHKIGRKIKNFGSHLEKIDNKEIVEFVEFERILGDFLAALVPYNLVFENILHKNMIKLYEEDEDLVEDLSLSIGQLIEITKSSLRHIVNIREAYSTIMSNNLNKTMKALTSITIIMTIPTIITSFYGMNVALPLQDYSWAYAIISLFTFVSCVVFLAVFVKKKLI